MSEWWDVGIAGCRNGGMSEWWDVGMGVATRRYLRRVIWSLLFTALNVMYCSVSVNIACVVGMSF